MTKPLLICGGPDAKGPWVEAGDHRFLRIVGGKVRALIESERVNQSTIHKEGIHKFAYVVNRVRVEVLEGDSVTVDLLKEDPNGSVDSRGLPH